MDNQQRTAFDQWFDSELDPELNLTPGDKELCRHAWQAALSHAEGEAEPVAYRYRVKGQEWEVFDENPCLDGYGPNEEVEPLYTHPAPQVAVPEGYVLAPDERKNPAPPDMVADCLYQAGYEDAKKERDYNPRACVEWQVAVDAMSGAGEREIAALREDACFLIERLEEFAADNLTDEGARDWIGHVEPAIARLRAAAMAEGGGQ